MKISLKKIWSHIEVLNHNSTQLTKDLKTLDTKFDEHIHKFVELKTDVNWLKKINWYILTAVIFGTLISIGIGIFFIIFRI